MEGTIDRDVGILIEPGVPFHTRFGCGTASDDLEILVEEANMPFERGLGVVVLERVGLALGFFDEFAVRDAGGRPVGWEMVGVELVETFL